MMRVLILTIMALSFVGPIGAQVGEDFPSAHWAYEAVQDLAAKGLLKGYPPRGDVFGGRTATRYEIASLIHRVLLKLDEIYARKLDTGKTEGVKPEQLEEVRRLTGEFQKELLVVGADLKKAEEQIAELQRRVDGLGKAVEKNAVDIAAAKKESADLKQDVSAAKSAASDQKNVVNRLDKQLRSHKISGYIQGRFDAFDAGRTSLFTNTGAGGTGQAPATGGPAVGGPFYGFQVRRARLNITGPISGRGDYRIQLDGQSGSGPSVYDANVIIADFPAKNVKARFGLFSPVFGYELPASSSTRESPERIFGLSTTLTDYPIFKTSQNATGGIVTPGSVQGLFVNQQRDVGAEFVWTLADSSQGNTNGYGKTQATLSVINGEGRSQSGMRNMNNGVDLLGRFEAPLANKLQLGFSGYYGSLAVRGGPPTGATPTPVAFVSANKILGGADIRWTAPWGTSFRAEWLGGTFESSPDRAQFLQGNHAYAWYFVARHPVTRRLDLVTKYDEYYPISQAGKTAGGLGRMELVHKTLGLGGLYKLDEATRFRLWYAKGLTPYDPSATSGPLRSRLGLVTGEVQVSF